MSVPDWIDISIAEQRLRLLRNRQVVLDFTVSTGANGPGELSGSGCTPRGWHQIRARIGADCPLNTVFVGRRPTGELYTSQLREQFPQRDWILTRILWLSGLESGRNRGGDVDTMRRYIYLHGTPDDVTLGVPGSHGCVRIANEDIVELFDEVAPGTRVLIRED